MRRRRLIAAPVNLGANTFAAACRPYSETFEARRAVESKPVAAFARNLDHLDKRRVVLEKTAYGIPFHITEAQAIDSVCQYHGASVHVHALERYLMPFWVAHTAAGGSFRADILQKDPGFVTQKECVIWVEGPNYCFTYPFGDHHPFNQVSASYLEPSSVIEKCVCGTHVPSMLISRFELLKDLEVMERKPKIIPFTMSTVTALQILETRVNRNLVLDRVEKELRKFHGSFIRSQVSVTSLAMEASKIRPVFLPLLKLIVSTAASGEKIPAYVCGATGKVTGPVLRISGPKKRWVMAGTGGSTLFALSPFVDPAVSTVLSIGASIASTFVYQKYAALKYWREHRKQMEEVKNAGLLYFASDQEGYRWSVEDEERQEYEYREELRRRARRRDAFEQEVKEEAARDEARRKGKQFDPKNRRRSDLKNVDPLGYYEMLGLKGVELSATQKEITKAFREAVRVHHPDVNKGSEEESKRRHMQRIIEAYRILRDPKTKKDYDAGVLKDAKEA